MGAGECGKDQLTGIWLSLVDMHSRNLLVLFHDFRKVGEVQLRIHTVGEHVQCQGDDIYISCTLTVAEKSTFHTVRAGKNGQLRVGNAGTPVVVRMYGQNHVVSVF